MNKFIKENDEIYFLKKLRKSNQIVIVSNIK